MAHSRCRKWKLDCSASSNTGSTAGRQATRKQATIGRLHSSHCYEAVVKVKGLLPRSLRAVVGARGPLHRDSSCTRVCCCPIAQTCGRCLRPFSAGGTHVVDEAEEGGVEIGEEGGRITYTHRHDERGGFPV